MYFDISNFFRFQDRNITLFVFKEFTKEFWIWNINIENKWYLLHKRHKGITSYIALLNTIYSASVVLKEIYVCNVLHHNTVNPAYVITYPVHDMTFYVLSASTWDHPMEKSEYT